MHYYSGNKFPAETNRRHRGPTSMFPILALAFLIVPIVEIYLLIKVGQVIGAGWTVALVVLTAVVGVWLLRLQGLSTLLRARQKLEHDELPAQELLEGVGLIIAGALLLTPGFFTDTLGFLLLLPPTRQWLVRRIVAQMIVNVEVRTGGGERRDGNVIEDVKYRRDD